MVVINPFQFFNSNQISINEILLNRNHCELVEAQECFLARRFLRVSFVSIYQSCIKCFVIFVQNIGALQKVLNSDTKAAIFIHTWLVGYNHSFLHWLLISKSCTNRVRAFVHIQRCTNTMASTMTIIQPSLPQELACKYVKNKTRRVGWKNHGIHPDVSLQHASKIILKLSSSFTKMPSPRHIRCTISILPSRINEDGIACVKVLHKIRICICTIMNDGSITSNTCNSRETILDIARLFCPITSQYFVDLNFTDRASFLDNSAFQPGDEMSHCYTIGNMCTFHTLHFCFILDTFHGNDRILFVDKSIVWDESAQCIIGAGFVDPNLCIII
mmetsp:Transcript_18502/g.27445  ORF Transcript_18502/g.27445 Transcript_18502/m.27445 type:complete len:330 (-) Transcript_18502:1190-2179(-)